VAMLVVKAIAKEMSSFNRCSEGCPQNLGACLTNIFFGFGLQKRGCNILSC